MGGGLVAVDDGRVIASLALPIAGLMSDMDMISTAKAIDKCIKAAQSLGSKLPDPFMTLSFLSLSVIPELKLTDMGLVDVKSFKFVPLFLGQEIK
jgi:adenine deaminase